MSGLSYLLACRDEYTLLRMSFTPLNLEFFSNVVKYQELRSLEDKMPRDKSQRRSWRSELKVRSIQWRDNSLVFGLRILTTLLTCAGPEKGSTQP